MRKSFCTAAHLRAMFGLLCLGLVLLLPHLAHAQFAQQGNKMVPSSPSGNSEFGQSVAVSSNGRAVVGGFADNSSVGAAWVFKGSSGSFTDIQNDTGVKLVGTGAVGASQQGWSVAISSDGSTIAVGGNADDSGKGAVWIFVDDGMGGWAQQAKLTVSTTGGLGAAVALSADGNTLVAGAPGDLDTNNGNQDVGAAFIFVRSGTTWSQQQKLVGTGYGTGIIQQGAAVAIQGVFGDRVIVGGPNGDGGVWFFSRSGSTWSQVGGRVIASDAGVNGNFGWSVAMSFFGDTAAVGGPGTGPGISGASWVYTFDGTNWTQQGNKIVGSGSAGGGSQGHGVALSSSGDTLVVGGPSDDSSTGAVWVFTRHNGVWTQQDTKLAPSDGATSPQMGWSVASTGSGNNFISGGIFDFGDLGAAWFFTEPPKLISIAPDHGPSSGNANVTLTGTGFAIAVDVTFDGVSVNSIEIVDPTTILVSTPAHVAGGAVDVTVDSFGGNSTLSGAYSYFDTATVTTVNPDSGPTAGNTNVAISGTHFDTATGVQFGGVDAASFVVHNASSISAVTPAHAAGAVDVTVTNPGGTGTKSSGFTFIPPPPTITSINPNTDTTAGGASVTILGTDLTGATAIKFGGTVSGSFAVLDPNTMVAIAPPHAVGAAHVRVTTAGGTSAAVAGDLFTYTNVPVRTVLHKFAGGIHDGGKPFGWLVADKDGALYGTTSMGGVHNNGTVFKLTPPAPGKMVWTKTILHSFTGADGAAPYAGLITDTDGALYGTTTLGGAHNRGVAFKLTPPGFGITTLHSFTGGAAEGGNPFAGLMRDGKGNVYGVASTGGANGDGTVFKLTAPSFALTVLHHFNGADGSNPQGTLLRDKNGNLYGTTVSGGAKDFGVAFKLTSTGMLTVLHSFTTVLSDGRSPYGGLFLGKDNVLYGATSHGGKQNRGLIFGITLPNSEDKLFNLSQGGGTNPDSSLTADGNGVLYGTAFSGGAHNQGAVFKFLPPANGQAAWNESLMYSFKGGTDGANPYANVLLGANHVLYGTTSAGGGSAACTDGCGMVFMLQY